MRNLLFVLGLVSLNAQAQVGPSWLDLQKITVEVLNDAGLTVAPRVRIKQGDRVHVRVYQNKAPYFLNIANRHAALAPPQDAYDQSGTDEDRRHWTLATYARARANYEAHNFSWVVGRDVSLAHVTFILSARRRKTPKADFVFAEKYRAPSAILLGLNDQEFQVSPPKTCMSALEFPQPPLRKASKGLDFMPDYSPEHSSSPQGHGPFGPRGVGPITI